MFNVLLQVLDDGRMTDGQGRTVDFKNTVLVMTSNLGSHEIQRMAGQDYDLIKESVMAEVRKSFRPEFVNRIDEIVVFHALDQKNIAAIAKIQLKRLEQRLAQQETKLKAVLGKGIQAAAKAFEPAAADILGGEEWRYAEWAQ